MSNVLKKKIVAITIITFLVTSAFVPTNTALAASGDTIVYVTKTGECYHADGCSCLRKSKIETTLQEAVDDGYRPCSKCKPGELDDTTSSTTTSSSTKTK